MRRASIVGALGAVLLLLLTYCVTYMNQNGRGRERRLWLQPATKLPLESTSSLTTRPPQPSHQPAATTASRQLETEQTVTVSMTSSTATVKRQSTDKRRGYMIGLHACDQLTGGAMNVLAWQCLTKHIDPSVHLVEPFVRDSSFGARLEKTQEETALANNIRLSDIYSIGVWTKFTDSRGLNRFVSWEEFLNDAPRDVIFVQNKATSCKEEVVNKEILFFDLYKFRMVRSVCLDYWKLSGLKEFKQAIYGNFTPSSVSVVVHRFCAEAVATLEVCSKGDYWSEVINKLSIAPSQRVLHDALKYTEKYLTGTENTSYKSVMIRLEHAVVSSTKTTRKDRIKQCLTKLGKVLNTSYSETGLNATFVTVDAGRFGSATVRKSSVNEPVKEFMHGVYGEGFSFEDWERTFVEVAALPEGGHGNSGYVAMMQKVIASQGRCLIQMGGGTFQESALELYKRNHKNNISCYHKEIC